MPHADADELNRARALLLERRIEPLLRQASDDGRARSAEDDRLLRLIARGRIIGFLASRLDLARERAEPELLSLEDCRRAWVALSGMAHAEIQAWAQYGEKALEKTAKAA